MNIRATVNMRISSSMQTQMLLEQMRSTTLQMFNDQQQLAGGKRLLNLGDDPAGVARLLDTNALLAGQTRLQQNADFADRIGAVTETALSDLRGLLNQAAGIASQNVGATSDAQQRSAAATVVAGLIDQALAIGNRQYNGIYIFAGQRCTQPPFERTAAGVLYKGDGTGLAVNLDGGQPTTITLAGDAVFGADSAKVSGRPVLTPRPDATMRLSDLKGAAGAGVRLGRIVIDEVGGAGSFTVDLTGSTTLGDCIQAINAASAAAGASVNASLTAGGLELTCAVGLALAVSDPGTGKAALDLGIRQTTPAPGPLFGGLLQPKVTLSTPVSWLANGMGIDTAGQLLLDTGSRLVGVDLSGVQTVQDVLNAIQAADPTLAASINADATGIDVTSRASGGQLSIGEWGGMTATTLGLRSLTAKTPLSSLNDGQAVRTADGADIRVHLQNGATVDVDLDGAVTVGHVLAFINGAAVAAGQPLTAAIGTGSASYTGNSLCLTDGTAGAGTLYVESLNGSTAAADLGLDAPATGGLLIGRDVSAARPGGIFRALEDLRAALEADDAAGITRAGEQLGRCLPQASRSQGQAAALSQTVKAHKERLAEALLASQSLLSDVQDADYTDVITRYVRAQTLMQANLMSGSKLLQMSLLDFLQ